jgi:hypothetical protein
VDFVHVDRDLTDLAELIRLYQENDAAAMAIARNSKQFVRNHLTYANVVAYWGDLLTRYAELQRFKPSTAPRPGFVPLHELPQFVRFTEPKPSTGVVAALRDGLFPPI